VISLLRAWRIWLSLGAGLALALAFPSYNLPIFGWVSVAGLLFASLGAGVAEAVLCGFLYGAVFYTFSLPWVYTVMRQYGPLPVWEAAGVLGLLVVAAALFCAAFSALVAWIGSRGAGLALFAAPFLWVALEFLRGNLPTIGFPWNLLGYTASGNLALVQLTAVTGIYGLSLVVAAYNALLVWAAQSATRGIRNRAAALWAGCTILLAAVAAFGGRFVPTAQPTSVAHLVQTDLPQSLEPPPNWDAIHAGDMAELDRISIAAGQARPGLVVWPEVPAPFSLEHAAFAQRAERIAHESQSDFLLGVIDWKPSADNGLTPYNSAALLDPAGREEFLYDKMHLVPFSEFIPGRRYLWFARDLTALVGDFGHGTRYAVGNLPGGRFSVFICYEAVFPNAARQFTRNGAALLINISNDGWFGRSAAPAQHLAMARVRAVENRRWLLRDTNNGFTASIDPHGRIVASLPPDVRGELDAPYGFREDLTLSTRWGDWPAGLAIIVSVLLLAVASFLPRGKRPGEGKKKG
jgi:apolipoprotein N-acyltransferase